MPCTAIGQLLERSGAAGREFLKPGAPARDRLDQRRITSRGLVVLCQSGQHQFRFGAAPLVINRGRQLASAVARRLRGAERDFSAQQRGAPHLDDDSVLLKNDLFRELPNDFGLFCRRAAQRHGKTGGTAEQSPHSVTGQVRSTEPFEQPCRAGQRVDQDADHAIFDLVSGEPPALQVIVYRFGDQRCGDVVAIAPAFLDRV